MSEPGELRTEAGRALFALLAEADVTWPNQFTRIGRGALVEFIARIEAEAGVNHIQLHAALARLDAPMDWDRDSPEDRLLRFADEVRAVHAQPYEAHTQR